MPAPVIPSLLSTVLLLRSVLASHTGLIAWWVAFQDGRVSRAERQAILTTLLVVEFMVCTVWRAAFQVLNEDLEPPREGRPVRWHAVSEKPAHSSASSRPWGELCGRGLQKH